MTTPPVRLGLLEALRLSTGSLDRAMAFYIATLGATVIEPPVDGTARLRLANVDLVLVERSDRAGGAERVEDAPGAGAVIPSFRAHDLAALRRALAAAGVEVATFESMPGGVRLAFRDTDGHRFHAVQYGLALADLGAS